MLLRTDDEKKYDFNVLGKTVISHLYDRIGYQKFVVTANLEEVNAVLQPAYRVGCISSFADARDKESQATTVQFTFDRDSTVDGYLSLYPMTPNRTAQVLKHYKKRKRPILTLEELTEIAVMKRGARLADTLGI